MLNALLNIFHPKNPITKHVNMQTGGHLQFLTVIGLLVALVTVLSALLYDLTRIQVFGLLKTYASVISLPLESVISILYWAIITIDPTLMMPPDIEFHLPFWLDASMHLAPSLILWVDFFCFSPAFPAHVSPFKVYAVVTTVYSAWIEYCSHMNGSFPYPFLNHLGAAGRVLMYSGSALVAIGAFKAGNGLHKVLQSAQSERKTGSVKAQ